MMDANQAPTSRWRRGNAAMVALACFLVGFAGGWLIRGPQSATVTGSLKAASVPALMGSASVQPAQTPTPDQMKAMADAQAAALMDKLKANPKNPDLLASIGNVYYDAQQYPTAIDYYGRALNTRPSNAAVRTDMATAYWFMGNADQAIAEFNKALTYAPNNSNALFNRGLVKWKGRMDYAGALSDWQKLLAVDPGYKERDKVEQMMAQVKKQAAVKP